LELFDVDDGELNFKNEIFFMNLLRTLCSEKKHPLTSHFFHISMSDVWI